MALEDKQGKGTGQNMPGSNEKDAEIRKILTKRSENEELACKRALALAKELALDPYVIGRHADEMKLKLVACQLGLFGYRPEKKIVKPADTIEPVLAGQIEKHLTGGRLPCSAAFEIAESMGIARMDVSSACEAMKVSIKPCQLGAF